MLAVLSIPSLAQIALQWVIPVLSLWLLEILVHAVGACGHPATMELGVVFGLPLWPAASFVCKAYSWLEDHGTESDGALERFRVSWNSRNLRSS